MVDEKVVKLVWHREPHRGRDYFTHVVIFNKTLAALARKYQTNDVKCGRKAFSILSSIPDILIGGEYNSWMKDLEVWLCQTDDRTSTPIVKIEIVDFANPITHENNSEVLCDRTLGITLDSAFTIVKN